MADSSTNLDLISASQASKEVTANNYFDAASPATVGGRRALGSSSLNWGYYGGKLRIGETLYTINNGAVALVASRTQQVEMGLVAAAGSNVSGVTLANPGVVTCVGHPFSVGQTVYLENLGGIAQLSNSFARITALTDDTFTINVNTTGMTAYTSGGQAKLVSPAGTVLRIAKGLDRDNLPVAMAHLYQVVTGASTVSSWTDQRVNFLSYAKRTVASADQADVFTGLVTGDFSGMTISDPPTQGEVEGLRDACEDLLGLVLDLTTLVKALRGANIQNLIIKGSA